MNNTGLDIDVDDVFWDSKYTNIICIKEIIVRDNDEDVYRVLVIPHDYPKGIGVHTTVIPGHRLTRYFSKVEGVAREIACKLFHICMRDYHE